MDESLRQFVAHCAEPLVRGNLMRRIFEGLKSGKDEEPK